MSYQNSMGNKLIVPLDKCEVSPVNLLPGQPVRRVELLEHPVINCDDSLHILSSFKIHTQ